MKTSARIERWQGLVLIALAVATLSVAAAQGGKATNTPVGSITWAPYAPGNPLQVAMLWGDIILIHQMGPGDFIPAK